ncbi:MAG: hypothetical protein DI626_03235 [Micavibrio aeruginosavorus]|uniref:Prepilin-type N-terminal cleavage/methylation domain-containing protein n=1 Tax=Micavibrio aeruginosavorus TaxID=349221 RepID=A0A2W5A5P9_9BACT|nr:MAG: hypothetical protein DI626_03235 [Micavibrio aeruginosavorus]
MYKVVYLEGDSPVFFSTSTHAIFLKEKFYMVTTHATNRRSEQGFTLVELAIVMVIIGLLIGGILKGQELINNAKISATVTQLKSMDAALNTFQDKYAALPGDMLRATNRLPNCATAPCNISGDGNSQYANQAGSAPTNSQEGTVAFAHLSAADLLSGISVSSGNNPSPPSFGGLLPAVKVGGGMWLGSSTTGGAAAGISTLTPNRTYLALNGTNVAVTNSTGALTPVDAAQIDRKIDDGMPSGGSVQSICLVGITNGEYDEGATSGTCAMYVRVLN